ncbi:hypothetical protein NLB96_01335 [Candidatus Aminicenantes bacterium AC-335-K20]|jgi:hypothetical protein|nr:hypothetical protein [SCandidatus Aminicenantes bacterium Aminicenantia_JdfR_composite]MCP2597002.1 hypothetical protein [Candidatus Aminicenantes bacterium AC-335-G13]MCP2606044.1 hypothetical protein [Candidatus Aminicenantes bacterium AC-708-I09]MCP2618401.1 hypothetical protein [Candidatus Aminicenantes bacterium AC-335-A11]MCP2619397.1 hypothetical protein [Candidatus Aminicenantes bacterium AC-335-K20]MCP2620606.1 hypothetical protein [Candidatus Aminicenantes bacterium AC-334-E05]
MSDFIEIKSEKIDVKEIMEKIKENIEKKKKEGIYTEKEIKEIEEMKPYPLPDIQDIHHFYSQFLYQGVSEVQQEKTPEPEPSPPPGFKKKIKNLLLKIMKPFAPIIKFLVLPVHQQIVETNEKLYRTDKSLEKLQEQFNVLMSKTIEYVKLLHNLSHHLVAELTKLKIEKEGMKTKMRNLENKIDLLEKREKVLEKEVLEEKK